MDVRVEHVTLEAPARLEPGEDVPAAEPGADPGTVALLRDVTLHLPPGRTTAVVGPTGAGKSTLTAVVARLMDPTHGRVLLDGVDARDVAATDRTRQVALVSQSTFVFDDTVRGNITLDDTGGTSDEEVWAALRTARAEDFVRALPHGLDTVVGERGATLSGGQRQRLAIARALVRRPRLLILDDATSAVDPVVEQEILTGLDASTAAPDAGVTVLLVAYRTATIALADHVVHLHRGQVVDAGSHAELLARDAGYVDLTAVYARRAAEREAVHRRTGAGTDGTPDARATGRRW